MTVFFQVSCMQETYKQILFQEKCYCGVNGHLAKYWYSHLLYITSAVMTSPGLKANPGRTNGHVRWDFKLDISCGFSKRRMGCTRSICPRHTTWINSSPAVNPDMWRELVRCSAVHLTSWKHMDVTSSVIWLGVVVGWCHIHMLSIEF